MKRKFADVLRIETWVVDVPRLRALVKSAHIWGGGVSFGWMGERRRGLTMPLKIRFRPKKICDVRFQVQIELRGRYVDTRRV